MENVNNLNIKGESLLPTPALIKSELPISDKIGETVIEARRTIENILNKKDKRLLVVAGPCSIHDTGAALEYAAKLKNLADKVSDKMFLIMRVYFEKPRTTVGWKGLINDPFLDDSFKINEGLRIARKVLIDITNLGVAAGTEALDPITPQYMDDLIAWTAIGARTTESQTHREMASGLSTSVGFKNGTDGNIQVAINALLSALEPHHFLGINQNGQCAVMQTSGNKYGHLVLRGGAQPNYDLESVNFCKSELQKARLAPNIMVDCSHGNSRKNHTLQASVFNYCIDMRMNGEDSVFGLMLESNLHSGSQALKKNLNELKYGVSITDACIDFEETEKLLLTAHARMP